MQHRTVCVGVFVVCLFVFVCLFVLLFGGVFVCLFLVMTNVNARTHTDKTFTK